MLSNIISVRPSRISGWCFDPAAPETALTVDLLVNGEQVAVLPCNLRRRELDPVKFPNRVIGFAGQLPFEFWTGDTMEITLRLSQDGSILDQREVTAPDLRIPGALDLFGEVSAIAAGRLTGWAASKSGPVGLDLAIDGRPYARAEVTSEMGGAGFAIWLPDDIYDGVLHQLVLTARLADGGLVPFATLEQVFAPGEARQLTGALAGFAQGRLSGTIQIAGWPDEPVTLVAEADGVEIGRTVSEPAQEGGFTLDLEPMVGLVPGQSRLEIYEEVSGLTPDFLAGDLVMRFLHVGVQSALQKGAERLELSIAAPLRLSASPPVCIEADTSDGVVTQALDMVLQSDGLRLTAQIRLSDLPAAPFALRLRVAADIVLDLDVPERVAAIEADWSLLPGGIVQGWVRDPAHPDRPVSLALCLNQVEVMQGLADRPVLLPGIGGARLPVACGFRFDLAQLGRKAGVAQVTITGPGGIDLPGSAPQRQRFPVASAAAALQPGTLYGMGPYPQVSEDAAALYAAPLDPALGNLLARVLGMPGKTFPANALLAERLVNGVLALAADSAVLQALARPGSQLDTTKWNPLTRPMAAEVAAALPLSPAGLAALPAVIDWRGLLCLLFSDDLLLPAILSQDDWGQMAALQRLRRAAAMGSDAAPLLLPFGAAPVATAPVATGPAGMGQAVDAPDLAAITAIAAQIAVVDPQGQPILQLPDASGVDLAEVLRARLHDPAAALRPGWRVLAVLADGTVRSWPLIWQDQRREAAARVHDTIRLSEVALTPRHASVTLTGQGLHRRVLLRLGKQKAVVLQACAALDGSDDADFDVLPEGGETVEQSRRYAAVLPAWDLPCETTELHYKGASPQQTFDLRLGEEDGRRPQGVPLWLADLLRPAVLLQSAVTLRGGQMTGWVFDQAAEPGQVRLALIETVPPSPEQLERNPDTPPADVVLAQATADQASVEAERLHMIKGCGYVMAMPASVLDGQHHALRLVARRSGFAAGDTGEDILWQAADFVASDVDMQEQIRGCATAADLHRLLLGLAKVNRFAVLDLYFGNPRSLNAANLTLEQTFEVLCAAMVQGMLGPEHSELERLFGALWALARQTEAGSANFAVIAAKTAMETSPLSPARYPHAPTVESVMDLVLTAPLTKAPAATFAALAAACAKGRRHQLAVSFLQRGLAAHSKDAGLLTQMSGAHLALGDVKAAEQVAMAALAAKPRSPAALMALARCYARQGNPLQAASALTAGKGLSAWQSKPPSYDQSKNFAGMDWVGVMRQAAVAADHPTMQASIARSEQVLGQGDRPEVCGLTLVLTEMKAASPPDLFHKLAPVGCLQLILDAEDRISEIDCIGRWVVILRGVTPDAALLSSLFAQLRPQETVAELLRGNVDDKGVPTGFYAIGAIIRSDALRAFGPVPLKTFLSRAATALRVKTILM